MASIMGQLFRISTWGESHGPGVGVTVATWGAFVDEMSMSRIYAGAHTQYANEVAEAMGRQVGRLALAALFRPLPARP